MSLMPSKKRPLLFASICLIVCVSQFASAQTKIRLVSPKSGATVGSIENFVGKISERGHPFILARPVLDAATAAKQKKNPWWIQKNCQVDAKGNFVGQVHFGNELTQDKTKFDVIGILVSNADFAKQLREHYSIDEIPRNAGILSRTSTFELSKTKEAATPNTFVTYPTHGDLVGRRETLTGIIPKYGTPVVFVKAADGENAWWVQSIIKPDAKGGFKCDLYFGNENTPNKSKFHIAVAVVENQDAQKLRKGSTMAKLPRDHLGLQTVTVQLEHQITLRNATRKADSN